MQTTAQRPAKARKPAITPYNATAARLIEQIQLEARAQLLTELSAKDAIIVLHGFDAATKRVSVDGRNLDVYDAMGNEVSMYRHHTEPEAWRGLNHMAGYWHPAYWYGKQTKVDATGQKWSRCLGVMVCNDFGQLVKVAA